MTTLLIVPYHPDPKASMEAFGTSFAISEVYSLMRKVPPYRGVGLIAGSSPDGL